MNPAPRTVTLVVCDAAGGVLGRLPEIEVEPPWWQDAEGVVEAARSRHGVEVTVLRLLGGAAAGPPGGQVTYLVEPSGRLPPGLPLAPWDGALDDHPLRLPYARPGGPARELAWARSALDRLGVRQRGPARQVRTWNLSSLWCIPVDGAVGGQVWLKSVPPFFGHEGAVIERLHPAPVPRVLAQEPGRVLLAGIPGTDQYDAPLPVQLALVSMLVDLQVRWLDRADELLRLGLPDWRGGPLAAAVADVVERTADQLDEDDRRTLAAFVDGLGQRFRDVEDCGIPSSLVHGDFAPGNARGDGDRLVILDWGDCGVGHPLLDASAFLDRVPAGDVAAVTAHWHQAWRDAAPGSDPARAAEALAPVAAARMAVVYRRFLDGIEPSEHPYHRDDPRDWLRRTAALVRPR